jgi:hypothetical protein
VRRRADYDPEVRGEVLNAEAESLVIERLPWAILPVHLIGLACGKSRQADPAGHGASTSAAETDDNQIAIVQARQ